ncbi:MAG: CDP-glycerol glycerophosphotransferase family protein [Campylobacterota bacterium]|nr:CDP-glycerol glycerophosphotransferase family protein [Campylobacterota bacterium]
MILKILKILINIPIFYMVKFIPKDIKLSIIGASLGEHFSDNSKYFYIYFHKINKCNYNKLIWITKNKKIVLLLKSYNLPVEYLYSFKGIYTTVKASKVFLSHQLNDINGPLLAGANIIQLWHGFPLKKIGYKGSWNTDNLIGKIKYFIYNITPFNYSMTCNKLIASNSLAKKNFKESFALSFKNNKAYKNILILGQPRNDIFEYNYKFDTLLFPEIKILKQYKNKFQYIISWLPTQRVALNKTIVDIIKESKLDLLFLDNFCKINNILFVFKPHFLDINLLQLEINKYKNLIIYEMADPYPLLKYTDILLTDYSSVYYDFLLTKKPIIFTPFDYDEYLEKVDFYQNYEEMTPGVKCYKWDDILKNIRFILEGNDQYKNERKIFLEKHDVKRDSSKLIYDTFFKVTS